MPDRCYVVKGEAALAADALAGLLGELRAAGLDVEELGGEELTMGSVAEACNAFFLGGADKAVVVREAERFKAADELGRLTAYLADPNPQTSLVLVLGGEAAKLLAAAKKAGATIVDPSPPHQARARSGWLAERLASAPVRLDRQAVDRLAGHLGEDLGRLPGILSVLAAAHGEGAKITVADLEPVLGDEGGSAPWDLTDAIDRGDVTAALHHLHRRLTSEHPFVVQAQLWGHVQRLLRLSGSGARTEAEAAALLGLRSGASTFPARKALSQVQRLGPAAVAWAVELLHRADLDLRGVRSYGGLPGFAERLTLEVLVARLARLAPPKEARRPVGSPAVPPARRRSPRLPAPDVRVEATTLANGLRVLLAPDPQAPSVAVVVRYDVGFRSEPEGQTGFAHLFEHLMFEGSHSLPKLRHAQLVQGNGGTFNGHTTPDATVYHEQLPPEALELGLFLEADRMRSVLLTEEALHNQIAVVQEEIRVNVLNRPYGGFPWVRLPEVLYRTYQNAHDGYGSFVDLAGATVADAAAFFARYYAPGNAVAVVAGAFDVDEAAALVERHLGDVPAGRVPRRPSFDEPPPDGPRHLRVDDPRAPLGAVAVGFRVPDPLDLDAYLPALLAVDVLTDGPASRLQRRLVLGDRLATHVGGYVGTFGDAFGQRDPVPAQLLAYHPGPLPPVLAALDEEVRSVAERVDPDELGRVVVANAAAHLRRLDDLMARAQLLAALEQVHGGTALVAELPGRLEAIGPDEVAAACARWFATDRRAVLEVVPGGRTAGVAA